MRSLTVQTDSCENMIISSSFNRCEIMGGLCVGILFSCVSMNDFINGKNVPSVYCDSPVAVLRAGVKAYSIYSGTEHY